jgi:SAM-dependent methyltransferase
VQLRIAPTVRGFCRRLARLGRGEFDYRTLYARSNLAVNHWSIVGPGSEQEFAALGAVKLKHLTDLGLTPTARVLDVGCGTGLLAAAMERYLGDAGRYVGVDLASEAVDYCRSRFPQPNFRFFQNEMTSVPLQGETFDAIAFYSVFTHTYPDETALLLGEARRLLAPGGFIFADAFTSPGVERVRGHRGAVVVNDKHLERLIRLAGLEGEVVMTLPGPRESQRPFWRLTQGR